MYAIITHTDLEHFVIGSGIVVNPQKTINENVAGVFETDTFGRDIGRQQVNCRLFGQLSAYVSFFLT